MRAKAAVAIHAVSKCYNKLVHVSSYCNPFRKWHLLACLDTGYFSILV